ncbi:MAG: SDR family oxidoreductase [Actinomycetaceae bacterium]|nr:SDR family oxidoreductase [Actinomycetaceae bacterium]
MSRKTVLVTGGSRGIGRAICENLSPDYHLLVGGRNEETVNEVVASLESAEPWIVDITDEDAIARAATQIESLDGLVLSAGIAFNKTIEQATHADWERMLGTNVIAQADLVRNLLPALRRAGGQVVAINSGSGFHSGPKGGLYSASKFALRAFTDALREEERGRIRVSSVHPGRVDTDMQVEIQDAAGRAYSASDHLRPSSIAAAVRLALDASEDAMVEQVSVRPVNLLR